MDTTPQKVVIVGDSAFAEIAHEYFDHDSPLSVVGFAVESAYRKRDSLHDLPVVDFETMEQRFAPQEHQVFVAVTYGQLNRLRERLLGAAKAKGYRPASYVSSRAFVWRNVEMGEHVFIFENNVVQPFVRIGDNTILWSGNHIGHHSTIGDHCFVSSHVVVSGFVTVGAHCFLGVNATIANNVNIAPDCWLGPNVVIFRDTERGAFYKPIKPELARVSALDYFKIVE